MSAAPLVDVKNVGRTFDVSKPWLNRMIERRPRQFLPAVTDVSFSIAPRETYVKLVSRVCRCSRRPADISIAPAVQLGQPSSQSGSNMKWPTTS